MPRSAFGPQTCPCAATYTMSGFSGWMRTRAIWRVSRRPTFFQVRPPSVDLYTPSPCETLPRIGASPVPT